MESFFSASVGLRFLSPRLRSSMILRASSLTYWLSLIARRVVSTSRLFVEEPIDRACG